MKRLKDRVAVVTGASRNLGSWLPGDILTLLAYSFSKAV